ncbi:LacI family transcriptional regulator [Evansella vedderi]|uniref:LacI family transcriptional regulator n=1 Tax=Evansella vedderi TaxID=38282 RepID=A0ABU0A322_9BACI|nr:LacI family DNA-binding transcriptional regulator [Evansella vedderi]MDQ0257366.1 LacI family transcriptional regulator [Evansella vedderi]
MPVKIKDIARICGVSAGTVDRAINNRPGINENTKKRILKVAKELNYRPNYTAQSLVKGKTSTLGVILFDLHNRSFAQLMNAIELKARENGYFVYITLTDKDPNNEKQCIEYLVERNVDGIILFSVNRGNEFEDYLKSFDIPIITVFNKISENWDYVGIRERQAMKDAVTHLVNKGYERFIYVSPPLMYMGKTNIYTQEERLYGFIEGLKSFNIQEEPIIIKEKNYIDILKEWNFQSEYKTAVVCSCDLYALEVLQLLKEKGVNVPGNVGVMGFDNIDVLKYVTPRLTTVEYPIEQIGSDAVESLISKIEHDHFLNIPLLDYKIILGESI